MVTGPLRDEILIRRPFLGRIWQNYVWGGFKSRFRPNFGRPEPILNFAHKLSVQIRSNRGLLIIIFLRGYPNIITDSKVGVQRMR